MNTDEAGRIVERFETVTRKIDPVRIRDERELPFPKSRIVEAYAIWMGFAAATGRTEVVGVLKASLKRLSQFQPGIGEPIDLASLSARTPCGAMGPPGAETATERTEAGIDRQKWRRYAEVIAHVESECKDLGALGERMEALSGKQDPKS